jgi:soluble lytic murein transglycosylase-like protein
MVFEARHCRVFSLLLAGFMVGVGVLAFPAPTKSDYEGPLRYSKQEIRRAIDYYAKRYRLESALLRAVIRVESGFRQHAVSRKGAVGLMQLTPDTAATLRVADPHDPLQNIRGGAKQLRHLMNLYRGDLPLTLAAYNAGVHRVRGHQVPRIRETRAYVRNVLKYYRLYKNVDRQARDRSHKGAAQKSRPSLSSESREGVRAAQA